MSYGSVGFQAVTAIILILFMVLGFLMPLASILTWMERRQSAMMQDRLGPNRANIGPIRAWGITHFLADAVKFIFKEDYVPSKAHKFLFMWAPIMAMAPALIVAAIIPFGPSLCWSDLWHPSGNLACAQPIGLQIARLDVGLLFYFAISSLAVYGATLAGWASHNKWAMMGGLRASSQMMSYEVTMGLAVLGAFLVFGSLEPGAIVSQQTNFLRVGGEFTSSWGIFMQPLGFVLFLTAAIAETKRTPFDIPEG
ncbi:MAG TPA: NADH-quinone oxidoreductase subunit H, partial [Polyangia bacterium]|nr:NADH-quinone oxidoreductase subunit H [Polyangia bacterium]